jgi:phenylacetate-CoA ligase
MIYFWGKAGYQVGLKYIFLRIWTTINRKGRFSAWSRNIVQWNIMHLDEENLAQLRTKLQSDRRIRLVLGYASTFEILANYLLDRGDTPEQYHLKGILSGAEILTESTRDKIQKVFGCPVISVYSNQENGLLAQECAGHHEFHVNNASYHFELLKLDSDEPAGEGESGRIVITDLFNHSMPLIRYDTGDIGIRKAKADCGWDSQALAVIEGGMVDFVYDTSGNRISPHAISVLMWPYDKLKQFQFIQNGSRQYILKLNGSDGYYQDTEFIRLFRQVLGSDAEIAIDHVEEIPVLNSGKRKIVVASFEKPRVEN